MSNDHKVTMGTRDAKIMRENEGKTPYELLQLGLSKAAYERLMNEKVEPTKTVVEEAPAPEPQISASTESKLTPDVVEHIDHKPKKAAAQPRLGRTADQLAKAKIGNRQVRLVGPTGIPQLVSEKQAQKMVARNPSIYKIV